MRHQEMNLLVIFDAIMTEGSITRAADRLAMTQPAVSNALSRMRVAWKDELFVKDGRGIQPTVFAQNIWMQVKEPLRQLEDAVDPTNFDPKKARRTFRIAAKDIFVDMAWVELRKIIEKEAPNINIHAIPNTISNHEQLLNDAEVDLVLGALPTLSSVIRSQYLMTPRFACVMRKDHPLAKEELTLEGFIAADHLLISASGDTTGITEVALAELGISRRIAMTVNHYRALVPLLKQTDLIAVVPSMAVEQELLNDELAVYETPVELPPVQIMALWHKRQDNDAGLAWLRNILTGIIRDYAEKHHAELQRCCRKGRCNEQKVVELQQAQFKVGNTPRSA